MIQNILAFRDGLERCPLANAFQVKLLKEGAIPPARMSKGAAGYDVRLCAESPLIIPPMGRALAPTGLAIACPTGTYARVAPRSGLAVREGVGVGAGVVDEDYRGEVKVLLFNHNADGDLELQPGDRIAQLVLEKIATPEVVVCDGPLPSSDRGEGGFGSTGST